MPITLSAKAAEKANRVRLSEARLQLSYTKVHAPISGRAGVIATKPGNLAKQHDNTLVTLLKSAPVQVAFAVPENLLPPQFLVARGHSGGARRVAYFAVEPQGLLGEVNTR